MSTDAREPVVVEFPLRGEWVASNGLPCAFRALEVERDGRWETGHDVIPRRADRVRFEPSWPRWLDQKGGWVSDAA